MNANDVIESYVADVAAKLPRKQRNDVAFELRSLLAEELQGKAEAAGRAADATMATELVNAFGRPAEVAARYQPTLTVIDVGMFGIDGGEGWSELHAATAALRPLPGGILFAAVRQRSRAARSPSETDGSCARRSRKLPSAPTVTGSGSIEACAQG